MLRAQSPLGSSSEREMGAALLTWAQADGLASPVRLETGNWLSLHSHSTHLSVKDRLVIFMVKSLGSLFSEAGVGLSTLVSGSS